MKKTFCLLTILIATIFFLPQAHAGNTMKTKLKRGIVNIVTAPLEIPKQTSIYWKKGTEKSDHAVVKIASGLAKGVINTIGRFGSGIYDVVTLNVDFPKGYQPLMKPDYVCDVIEEKIEGEINPNR